MSRYKVCLSCTLAKGGQTKIPLLGNEHLFDKQKKNEKLKKIENVNEIDYKKEQTSYNNNSNKK
eukprot:gene10822-3440_t